MHCFSQAALTLIYYIGKSKCATSSDLIALSASGTSDLGHGSKWLEAQEECYMYNIRKSIARTVKLLRVKWAVDYYS